MSRAPRVLFAIGAGVSLLTALAHLAGHFSPPPPPESEAEATMRNLMETLTFQLPGAVRSTMDLFKGFSLVFSAFLLFVALLDLVLLRHAREDPRLLRAVGVVNAGGFALLLGISLRYFFAIPTACLGTAFLSFVLSVATNRGR